MKIASSALFVFLNVAMLGGAVYLATKREWLLCLNAAMAGGLMAWEWVNLKRSLVK